MRDWTSSATWTAASATINKEEAERRALDGEDPQTFVYYGHAWRALPHARRSDMSDDRVTSCASLWHRYVSEELSQSFAASDVAGPTTRSRRRRTICALSDAAAYSRHGGSDAPYYAIAATPEGRAPPAWRATGDGVAPVRRRRDPGGH